jgi:hypothetical protein
MSLDPITALLNVGESVIDKIWPDENKRLEQKLKLRELAQKGDLAVMQAEVSLLTGQMDINKEEAKSKSLFVAGWRPFVGWVGGVAFAYITIIEPLMRFIALVFGYDGKFPVIDTTITLQVLFGMLGLGVMRSFDKKQKTQTDKIN